MIKKRDFFRSNIGAKIRGDISEAKFQEALKRLKRRGQIVDYLDAAKMNLWDSRGVDFIVVMPIGSHYKTVFLQIKSSWVGVIQHRNDAMRIREGRIKKMFNILVVIVNERDSVEDLCMKILKIIQRES